LADYEAHSPNPQLKPKHSNDFDKQEIVFTPMGRESEICDKKVKKQRKSKFNEE
jgi:hypothetical protein